MAGEQFDSPNQEVVGVGHPSVEGDGGAPGTRAEAKTTAKAKPEAKAPEAKAAAKSKAKD